MCSSIFSRISKSYEDMKYIFGLFIFWRTYLFFVAWLGERILTFSPTFPYSDVFLLPSKLPSWIWSFANFDGVHYLTIIKQGYSSQFTQVFFPLYPLIIRFFSGVFYWINSILAGLIVTNAFFLMAMFVFFKLVRLDYRDKLANWSILFLLIFPTSFFFASLYTESLFILLVFLAFYTARKKKWWLAGLFGGLASATRLAGIFLLPALLWEWQQEKLKIKNEKLKMTIKNSKLSKYYLRFLHFAFCILHSPTLYLVPLGLIVYMVYLQLTFGDWLYFWHAQPVFGAERSGQGIILLPQVIFRYFKILTSVTYTTEAFWVAFSEVFFTLFAIFMLAIGHKKKVRASYLIFSWLGVITPTLTGTFSSMPRYILIAFPIYIILGMIRNDNIKSFILILNFILMVIFTVLFTSGHWVA